MSPAAPLNASRRGDAIRFGIESQMKTDTTDEQKPPLFKKIQTGRISDAIVEQIRSLIRSGALLAGTRLPPEREFCEQLGVSRLALREALRMLAAVGLIQNRTGARGGTFVSAPTAEQVGEGLTDLLTNSTLSAQEVTQARQVLETAIIPLVCANLTQDDIKDLRRLNTICAKARAEGTYTVSMSVDFHVRIATATHNKVIELIMHSLRDALMNSLDEAHHDNSEGIDEHFNLIDAIEQGDASKAQSIMQDHIKRTKIRVEREVPESKAS